MLVWYTILVLLHHFHVYGWIFLLCSGSENVVKCPRRKVAGSRDWISVCSSVNQRLRCEMNTSQPFWLAFISLLLWQWLLGCKDTTFSDWKQSLPCWPLLFHPFHGTQHSRFWLGQRAVQWWTSDRMLGACALGRDSECYSDKCTATKCVGHWEKP